MGSADHKQILKTAFAELARGNGQPLLDALAEDVEWTIIGTTKLSKTFKGKQDVIENLLTPFSAALEGYIEITPDNLIAEGDYVVVQGRGKAKMKTGVRYDNTYCWVYRFADGRIAALTEYLDTELVTAAFGR